MYKRPEYLIEDYEPLFELMSRHNFATLISSNGGEYEVSHLPFLVDREPAPLGTLTAHMAKENPQWETFAGDKNVLIVFRGPHAYISPSWYLKSRTVPTWNYAVVHAYGAPRLIRDNEKVWRILSALIDKHEESDWRLDRVPEKTLESFVEQIVTFEIPVSRLEGKFKLSQDKPEIDRANVIRVLQMSPGQSQNALGNLMIEHPPG